MTTAAVVATDQTHDGMPAALLPAHDRTLIVRVIQQLHAQRIGRVHVFTRPEWVDTIAAGMMSVQNVTLHAIGPAELALSVLEGLAPAAGAEVVVADGTVLAHDSVAWRVLSRPGPADLAVADAAGIPVLVRRSAFTTQAGTVETQTGLLQAAGAGIEPLPLDGLFVARPRSAEEAAQAWEEMRGLDEHQILLRAAVKRDDGFFTTFFVTPYTKHIAGWAARAGLTPNQVTMTSLLLGFAAAGAFAAGDRVGLVIGAILLQVSFAADVVDGQLARYARRFSELGAWLDATFDRVKEYAVFAGLALGAARVGESGVWLLASAALALQVVRHMLLFSYAAAHAGAGAPGLADRLERRSALKWVKRIIVLPIGERLALISIVAAVADARAVFIALLAWGSVALAYTLAGRIARSVALMGAFPTEQHPGADALAAYRDDGPLAAALGRAGRAAYVVLCGLVSRRAAWARTAWLVPPLLHAGEYAAVVALAAAAGPTALPAAFGLLGAVAYHHYDIDHRLRLRGMAPPAWVTAAGLGWDGRVLVLSVAAVAGVFTPVAIVLAVWCAVVFVGESVRATLTPSLTEPQG